MPDALEAPRVVEDILNGRDISLQRTKAIMPRALVIDDDPHNVEALTRLVQREGFVTSSARSVAEARERLQEQTPDLVFTDLVLPDGSGMDVLKEVHRTLPAQVILVTGHASVDSAVEALRAGASDYLVKPIDTTRLRSILHTARRTLDLESEIAHLREHLRDLGRFGPMVGVSPPMQRIYELAARVAPTDASVLITGESGTGKEVLAHTLHSLSKRRNGPLIAVNCAAVSPSLIESELFGHERGSFTGAERQHRGFFERASGGTLFLDEIAEMPLQLQVKLLRVLETSTVERVGGEGTIQVDARVIAATNRSPEEAVRDGKLRDDLLYRLNVFSLHLVPLRERGDDVLLLAEHFLSDLNKNAGTSKTLSRSVLKVLRAHSWPGNVRELRNVVEHAFILAEDQITPHCLPPELTAAAPTDDLQNQAGAVTPPDLKVDLGTSLAEAERRLILATLERCEGDKKRAAEVLGISVKTIYNRLNSYRG
jgi:two-component system, NtrC family, response regulator AtoC